MLSKTVDLSLNSYLIKCDLLNKKNRIKNINMLKCIIVRLRNDKELNFLKVNKTQNLNSILYFLLFILAGKTPRIKMLNVSTTKNINDKKDKVFVLEFKITNINILLHFLDFYTTEINKKTPIIKKYGSQLKTNISILTFKEVEKLSNSEKYSDFIKNFNLEIVFSLSSSSKSFLSAPSFLVV